MARVLIAIPDVDFDPTEAAVPWRMLRDAGHDVTFATESGQPGACDPRLITGDGFGPFKAMLMARADARADYAEMIRSPAFLAPTDWGTAATRTFDALLLPGGHAAGVRPYIASDVLQSLAATMLEAGMPVAAICHGVLVAARARGRDGKPLLHARRTTALPKSMELSAWLLTCTWLGDYYRTCPQSVEDEVRGLLADAAQFDPGPRSLRRDHADDHRAGFIVRDGNWLSARWPGDAHRFGAELLTMLS